MKLYLDITNKRLMRSASDSMAAAKPIFARGDQEPISLYLYRIASGAYEAVSAQGESITAAIGRLKDTKEVLASATVSDIASSAAVDLTLGLNTEQLAAAIDGKEYIDAFFEVEKTDTNGKIETLVQYPCRVKNDVIDGDAPLDVLPTIEDIREDLEEAEEILGEVQTLKGEIEAAGETATGNINTAKTSALGDIGTAKTSALAEITAAGASYQRQIDFNSACLNGGVYRLDHNAEIEIAPFSSQNYTAWNGDGYQVLIPRETGKFTVIARYLPISGDWSLFKEGSSDYGTGACLRVAADGQSADYFLYYNYDDNYSSVSLSEPLTFGDIVSYVYDGGNIKIYKNKTLVATATITDSNYLSGYFIGFYKLLRGDNIKQNFLLSVGNAFPIESNFAYSVSDFVDGVPIPAGMFLSHSNINLASFADGAAFTASYVDGTYSQTFGGETACAKFVPGGLHATTKRARSISFPAGYRPYGGIALKVRLKFYLPATNAHWKYICFSGVEAGSYGATELTSVLDAKGCAAAADAWQTVELRYLSEYGTTAFSSYAIQFRGDNSSTGATREAISSAANDAFYIAEYSIEYSYNYAIDNYVEAPLKNGVFVQRGSLPCDMVCCPPMGCTYYEDAFFCAGDKGANTVVCKAAVSEFPTGYGLMLTHEDFDQVPYGHYWRRATMVKINERSSLGDTDIVQINGKDFTKSDTVGGYFVLESAYPNDYLSIPYDFSISVSLQNSEYSGTLSGEVMLIFERIS